MATTINASASSGLITTADTSTVLQLQTNGTAALTIDASANVGIGTASPASDARLTLASPTTESYVMFSRTNSGVFDAAVGNNAGSLVFKGGADSATVAGLTEFMRIDSSGNVGIGTSSPTGGANRVVDVYGSGSSAINFHNATSGTTATDGGLVGQYGSDLVLYNYEAGIIQFGTSNAERARIDSSGNLAVGRSSALDNYLVTFEKGSDKNLILNSTTSGNGVYTTMAFANQSAAKAFLYWYSTDSRFYVQNGTGGVYLAQNGTTWTSASDERFKTSLVPIEDAVNKVSALRAVTGRFLEDEENVSRAFLIAQDVQAVFPQAVDADDPEKLGVRYTDTIPLLVAAIKEQQAIITSLTDRITALEGTTP